MVPLGGRESDERQIGILHHDRGGSNGALYNASIAEGMTGCENCTTFHGDYINVAYGSDGKANMAWTDMRDLSDIPGLF